MPDSDPIDSNSAPDTAGLTFPSELPFRFDAQPDPTPATPPEEAPDDTAQ